MVFYAIYLNGYNPSQSVRVIRPNALEALWVMEDRHTGEVFEAYVVHIYNDNEDKTVFLSCPENY